ncbi:hypothetical protein D3C87_1867200 [compost metagenome]
MGKDFPQPELALWLICQFVNDQAGGSEDLLLRRQSQQRQPGVLWFTALFQALADFLSAAPRGEVLPLLMQ